jgi:hypothetical protein
MLRLSTNGEVPKGTADNLSAHLAFSNRAFPSVFYAVVCKCADGIFNFHLISNYQIRRCAVKCRQSSALELTSVSLPKVQA